VHRSIRIPKPEETEDELTQLATAFDLLHGLVDSHVFQRMARALQGGEFSFSQLNALYRLYRFGPQTIAELAEGAALSQTAASRMVERLVQQELVARKEVPTDRRQKRVELTDAGIERLQDLQAFTVHTYAELLREVPREALARLNAILVEIRPHLPTHPLQSDPQPALTGPGGPARS
jgi:DNA-binding MarR family transcriptional regulator